MSQEQGFVGRLVGSMIRRSVRARFHSVYYRTDGNPIAAPAILYANHHGWMDGYLLFHLVSKLGLRCVDWIEEFDAFPFFASVGGMRFSKHNVTARAKTVRQTIRMMKQESFSLVIFPEGVLHRPPTVLPFGRAIEVVANGVRSVWLTPIAIRYELAIHERPEAWISVGEAHQFVSTEDCRQRLLEELQRLELAILAGDPFEKLVSGTADVNERWEMRRVSK